MTPWKDLPTNRLLIDLSLWSADLTALGQEIQRFDPLVDLFHFDISDAHFTPGLLFFPDLIAALRPLTTRLFHLHLMVAHPETLVQPFLISGADLITVHVETGKTCKSAIGQIREAGKSAGLSLKLETSIEEVIPYLDSVDLVLLMGTSLGIKGQGLAQGATERIQSVRRMVDTRGLTDRVKIFADGGIRQSTVPALRTAGADGIVPGSLIFKSPDPPETIRWLHSLTR